MSFNYEAAKDAACIVAAELNGSGKYKDDYSLTALTLGHIDEVRNLTADTYADRAIRAMRAKYEFGVSDEERADYENRVRAAIVQSQMIRQ